MMKYIKLCDMNLSQIVLGTEGFDERIDKKTAFEMMDFYLENGGNILDTARMYCGGKSEEAVGEYIKGKRDNIYISTKCSHPLSFDDLEKSRLDKEDIEYDVDKSLKALGIDRIDILWLHRDDEKKAVAPIIDTLNGLVKEGKVRYFGASNWSYERIQKANQYAEQTNQMGFCASQGLYNLATRSKVWDHKLCYIDEDKEKYDRGNIPVFAFSSQAKGFFEKYATGELSQKAKDRYLNDKSIEMFKKIKKRAEKENTTISYMALKMLCEKSCFDVFPIIGPSKVSQIASTLNIEEERIK